MARARRLPLAAVAVVGLLAAGCGGGSSSSGASGTSTERAAAPAAGCAQVAAPAPRAAAAPASLRRPPLARGKTWTATVATSCGTFRFSLDVRVSPHTTSSFAALANAGYYDGTIFHRIVPGFVVQAGDPSQTGEGGPGYSTRDVPPPSTRYRAGMVAMAKTGAEPAGTAGSQFFVLTGAAPWLTPDYALLGRVTSGMAVVRRIGRLGRGESGVPTRVVLIRRLRVAAG
jgi:peptidyl-prolyl cis-trans isomerase B (cyclophilin B)